MLLGTDLERELAEGDALFVTQEREHKSSDGWEEAVLWLGISKVQLEGRRDHNCDSSTDSMK